MSERYLKLFSLEENLYIPGSPVLIAASALLKDMQTGRILGQLKLQSISNQEIKAATVELLPLDTTGNPLGDAVSHQYLDLTISRDDYWGSNEAILFPDASTRAYIVKVKEVIFLDNSIWSAPSVDWKALPKKILLEESLNDLELTKQYRLHFGKDCKYTYQSTPDLWYCPCGTINHREEAVCHRCKKEAAALSSVDLDLLQEEARERIKQEKEEEEAKKIAHQQRIEAQKAIWKKRMPYAILLCIVILMVTVIISKSVEHHKQQKLNHAYAVVCDYIRENGVAHTSSGAKVSSIEFNLTSGYGEWTTYQNSSSEPKILCTFNQFVGGDISAVLDPESNTVSLELTTSPAESDSYASDFNYDIPYDYSKNWVVSAKFDADSYSEGKTILPDEWSDASGESSFSADSWEENWGKVLSHKFSEMLSCLDESLQEYGLGISVADLGFTSY